MTPAQAAAAAGKAEALASVWAVIAVAAIALVGTVTAAWLAGRAATRASKITGKVQDAAVKVDREGQFMDGLLARLAAVEGEAAACRRENTDLVDEVRRLKDQVGALSRRGLQDRQQIALGALYMTQLRTAMAEAGQTPPPPPFGLILTPAPAVGE